MSDSESTSNPALPPSTVSVVAPPSPISRILKRAFDVTCSFLGLLVLLPAGLVIALIMKISDPGPIFYRQRRVGQFGQEFEILKFRTMVVGADKLGPSVTQDRDPRITLLGRLLRKTKLDELPQLWNVLCGSMSFVGPRPEVPRYVAHYTPEQRQLLNYKPGITDLATLVFRNEEALLKGASDVEAFYIQHCIPRKFHLNMQYAKRANLLEDVFIIAETIFPYWVTVMGGYLLALSFSWWMAYQLRYDFAVPAHEIDSIWRLGLVVVPCELLLLCWRKQFVGLLSYFELQEVKQLVIGLGVGGLIQLGVWMASGGSLMPARSIIILNVMLALTTIGGARLALRMMRERKSVRPRQAEPGSVLKVGVVGADEMGLWLVRQFNVRNLGGRRVEALFDDNPDKWRKVLKGVQVVGMPECILDGSWTSKLDEIIIAMPTATPERVEQIRSLLISANMRCRIVPSIDELIGRWLH
ncbi:MAG: sugar transferase [Verrucomicrobiales bacterium]|nr:sugar transferase [Verrucomicrobiales bacterium]